MRCGNCGQTGHNRRTCTGGGGAGYGGGGGYMQPRRVVAAQPAVRTRFSCSGGQGGNRHILYILVSSSGISAIVPRSAMHGGGATYYCPTHGCRVTRA